MLVCVCVWEVLRRGGSRAKEDLVRIHVEKSLWRVLEKAVQAIVHRNAAGQEIVGPGRIWGAGFSLATAFSQKATAAPGRSAAVHSLFLLFRLALGVCRRWDCSAASASSLLQGGKGSPAFCLQQCQSLPVLAWIWNCEPSPLPLRAFHASWLPPSRHRYTACTPQFKCHLSQLG